MADSFQNEVPNARINLKLDLHTGGVSKKTELPLKLLVAGDFSNGQESAPLSARKKVNLHKNNFDAVLSEYSLTVNLTVKNTLAGDGSEDTISLTFRSMKDFTPEQVSRQIPRLAGASDPQAMMQTLAQTVFRGKSVDLTDTRQYGSLISASLGEEWSGFGSTVFVQPLTQAWETVLQPSAAGLNDKWRRSVVANWHTAFDGRFPFAASKSDASLPMLAEFVRKDSGRIERFLTTELSGVQHKEGSQWVADKVNSQGLNFNPAFLRAINQLSQLSDILFTDGSHGISFELQARPVPQVVETRLTIDGQELRYFNQMAGWQSFRWPGETYRPGTMLTWTTVNAGARLFGDYSGTWGFIRWLEQGERRQLDRSQWMMSFTAPDGRTLQWVLRSQLGSGPLALLDLRGFTLPDQIFSVDSAATAQALMASTENSDMEGVE